MTQDLIVKDIDEAKSGLKRFVNAVNELQETFNEFAKNAEECNGLVGNSLNNMIEVLNGIKPLVNQAADETDTINMMLGKYIDQVDELQNTNVNLEV